MVNLAYFFTARYSSNNFQKLLDEYHFWPTTILICVALLGWFFFSKKSYCITLFQNTSGKIDLSRNALGALIGNTCSELGIHDYPKVSVKYQNKKIHLNIKLKIRFGQNVGQITTEVQNSISRALQEDLRIENLGNINIYITGFNTRKKAKAPKLLPENKPPESLGGE